MGDLDGRVYVVTGANTGIGRVTALELARRGATTVLACRSEAKTQPVVDAIRAETGNQDVSFIHLDLSDFDSVRACAKALAEGDAPLHVLINNAGLAGQRGLTKQGFELAFGVNHLGHFLFTQLLLDKLAASAPARIVNVSSKSHYDAKNGIDFEALQQSTRTVTGLPEYEVSKLANVLHAKALAQKLADRGITTYSLHPGVVATDVWRRVPWPFRWLIKLFMISAEDGAKTTLLCATDPALAEHSGRFYSDEKEKEPNPLANDPALIDALWERSLEWTGAPDVS